MKKNSKYSGKNVAKFPFPHVLKDLIEWSNKAHAEIVYYKCLRAKKHVLANKIARKYGLRIGYSDLVIASAIALSLDNTMKDGK